MSVKELCVQFNEVWYRDPEEANVISKEIVKRFSDGEDSEFLNVHYDRIFSNLNFTDIKYQKRAAVLCFPHYESFKPSDITLGKKFSGSEEALVYMSQKLAQDYRVVVYANVSYKSAETLKPSNPRYVPFSFQEEDLYDMVICWRMYDFDKAKRMLKQNGKIYLWVQDLPPNYIDTKLLDGAFYLSEYQKNLFTDKMSHPVPYVIAGNGLLPEYYEGESIRKRHSCFYGSNYGKGLKVLLEIWDKVLAVFPDATLYICFGRTNWCTISDQELNQIVEMIARYPSVIECGRLSNKEVAAMMKSCSIFSYPCTSETATFEITAVQAQASGCIPVVLWKYCLPEVVHSSAYHCNDAENYLSILLQAIKEEDSIDRSVFEEWGKQFTWDRVKDKWYPLINL